VILLAWFAVAFMMTAAMAWVPPLPFLAPDVGMLCESQDRLSECAPWGEDLRLLLWPPP
jgi:hypothetical protein